MIVLDASTLILLARAELLEAFLGGIHLPIAIPKEVERECCAVKKSLDALLIQRAIDQARIRVWEVNRKRIVAKLQTDFRLGKGEAEAIALSLAEKAVLLGIDDKNGINACKVLGVAFTTAVAILVRCRENGLLDHGQAFLKLEALARYGRYRQSILDDAARKLEAVP